MSIPNEILKKVKLLEIKTRKIVNNTFGGEYHTVFKGQGMTFAEFREYVPGDDVRAISWALTARTGKTYIKKFDEERELTLFLAVDVSGSGDFGSGEYFKGEVLVHLAALLAMAATQNKDQVGLMLFSDRIELFIPPGKGHGHVHRLIRELYYFRPQSRNTNLQVGFQYLQSVLKKKASIFVLSDFMDSGFDSSLRLLGKKHDVVALVVKDPVEEKLPAELGLIDFEDAETGEITTVDASSTEFQHHFQIAQRKRNEEREKLLKSSQIDRIDLFSDRDFVAPIAQYFRRRGRG